MTMLSNRPEPLQINGKTVVHVYRGRQNHLSIDDSRMWTVCARRWVGEVTGPPSSDRPMCRGCLSSSGEGRAEGTHDG